MSEADLEYLQTQIEKVSVQKRCQAFELELTRLTEELRTVLPDPLVTVPLDKEALKEQMDPDGRHPLPAWCGRVAEIVRNMSQLLSHLTGVREGGEKRGAAEAGPELGRDAGRRGATGAVPVPAEASAGCRIPHVGMASAFSHRLEAHGQSRAQRERAEREIQQSGVSVRDLRSNFEGKLGGIYPFAGFVADAGKRGDRGGQGVDGAAQKTPSGLNSLHNNNVERAARPSVGEHGAAATPVMETVSLRKERIVVLFLSHWKKSAYAITVRAARRRQEQGPEGDGVREPGADGAREPGAGRRTTMLQFFCKRAAVDKMLHSWRNVRAERPGKAAASASRRTTYSPEQFLRASDGVVAASHDDLTLELFMLGYFRILEQELAPEERKMRHLLCFEVFDHVGDFPWETVRDFHKAVVRDVQAGRRRWGDGFEDVKARFFGEPSAPRGNHRTGGGANAAVAAARAEAADQRSSEAGFSCFSNGDICQYIDRSFAFWKEKEAELFDFAP